VNYRKHYDLLIEKAKSRVVEKSIYTEKHHIIPRSEGGLDKSNNIVELYPREHFIAHWLLYRENPTLSRGFAFNMMSSNRLGKYKPSSRAYAEGVQAAAKAQSENLKGRKTILHPETKKKKLVWPYELDFYLELGYTLGMKGNGVGKGRFWINNGVQEKYVKELEKGWKRGRLKSTTEGKKAISKDGTVKFVVNVDHWIKQGWKLGNEKYYPGWKHMKRYEK
jgi:hypothetical protein